MRDRRATGCEADWDGDAVGVVGSGQRTVSGRGTRGAVGILDEFAAVTGYHRKHALRLLAGSGKREEADGFVLPARACA